MTELAAPTDLPPEPAPAIGRLRAAGVLVALLMGLLLGALDNFIVVTALPTIAYDLSDVAGAVFVVSGYLIAQTVAIPIFGKLSDRYGRRSFYLLGLVVFLAGSVFAGLSQNLNELILGRAIQGAGSGAFFTVVFSIIADLFPPKAAARLAGFLSGVFGIAIVFGPLIGSYIVDTTTWRWIFFVNLPVGFAAIALVLLTIGPLHRPRPTLSFDALGSALLATWVGTLIFALEETSNGWAWTDPRTLGLLAVALAVLPLFLWREAVADDPIVPLRFFRIRRVASASGVNFLRGALLTVAVVFVPLLVQNGLGGSADDSRDILYAFMIPMILGAALGGGLVGRFGYRLPTALGLTIASIGAFLLTATPVGPPIYRFDASVIPVGLAGALIPVGFGVGLTFAPTQLAIQYAVPRKDVGTGNSLVWFLGNLGGSIIVSVLATYQLTRLTDLVTTGTPIASAWAQSIQSVWWAMVPVAVVALAFAIVLSGKLPAASELEGDAPAPAAGPM